MGDRSGGREPKGASLKKSKKNPGASAAKAKKASLKAPGPLKPSTSLPPPLPANAEGLHFDCGVALLSRQFDRDRDRVIARAQSEGKSLGMLLWFADIEKQQAIADLSKVNSGVCYYATGVHPDNIDRTNKKSHEEWMEKTEELAKRSECLAILSGLNLSREMATHFSQESLLKASAALAAKLLLPVVLHIADSSSLDRALELLTEEDSTVHILVHDVVTATSADIRYCSADHTLLNNQQIHYIITAAGITDADETMRLRASALISALPLDRLLVASDSPWRTPQNLSDPYLRTLRNEPSNLPAIVEAIASIRGMPVDQMAALLRANSQRVFGLDHDHEEEDGPAEAAEAAEEEEVVGKLAAVAISEPSAEVVKAAPRRALTSYSCAKCRAVLFTSDDVISHTYTAAKKAVFKVGEEGMCASFVFVQAHHPALSIISGAAACESCGCKLGKHSEGEALCSCGKAVPGPVCKLLSSKLDCSDVSTEDSPEQLAERARLEILHRGEEVDESQGAEKRKIKKGKKHKSENKGNFSSFRNKSFVPNASKLKGAASGDLQMQDVGSDEEDEEDA